MKKVFMNIFHSTCTIFSLLILAICMGLAILGTPEGFALDHSIVFALFIFSFVISCTTAIYSAAKLNGALKYVLHLAVTLASSAVFLRAVNGLAGKTVLVCVVIIAILHASFFAIIHSIKNTGKKQENYKNVYNKESSK